MWVKCRRLLRPPNTSRHPPSSTGCVSLVHVLWNQAYHSWLPISAIKNKKYKRFSLSLFPKYSYTQYDNCLHCIRYYKKTKYEKNSGMCVELNANTMPFYIRNLSIHRFWQQREKGDPGTSLQQILRDLVVLRGTWWEWWLEDGWIQSWPNLSRTEEKASMGFFGKLGKAIWKESKSIPRCAQGFGWDTHHPQRTSTSWQSLSSHPWHLSEHSLWLKVKVRDSVARLGDCRPRPDGIVASW
jgi:hypothetical protein